jgi:hypothetical protein
MDSATYAPVSRLRQLHDALRSKLERLQRRRYTNWLLATATASSRTDGFSKGDLFPPRRYDVRARNAVTAITVEEARLNNAMQSAAPAGFFCIVVTSF